MTTLDDIRQRWADPLVLPKTTEALAEQTQAGMRDVAYLLRRLELAEAALNEWASETFPGHALCKRGTCDYCDSYPAYLTWHEVVQ